jgi:hypothetical protein
VDEKDRCVIPQFYKQLQESEKNVERKTLYLSHKPSDQDAFWVERIDENLQKEVGCILSTLPYIKRFVSVLQNENQDALTPEYCRSIQKTLN